ncbi:carboxylate--amine ligase [Roseimaritima ulvae]|uniref:Carbamoyl phosphate synthase-like protein n=1 Tax=Roseimaritima ulvae TaxID=980254 RepID=A0A5B9R6H5_9BACT|nr:ATP-grasp domain-containing protein [Roseimaritima ulvae]QEG41893.1 carbamoyl phosphate synthase-like protein [Roseimaritima ulvae]
MKSESSKPKVLVTDACRGAAVATIRTLARNGYQVIAADREKTSPGLASRFATHRVVYACPTSNPQQFIEDILAAVERYQIDMIVPVTEQAVLPLEFARARIQEVCKVPWAPTEAMATVRDKHRTFELAEQLGVPYPRTRMVHTTEEALQHGPDLGWPLVLKPNSSHTLRDDRPVQVWSVAYAHSEQELREKMRPFEGQCPVLLQEYFQGAGVGVEVLAYEGNVLCAFQHRRLREVPLTGGASSLRRSEPLNPVLYEHTLELIKALKWTGLAMAEFKWNERGECRLMEINGRIWGSLPVAIAAGVDFPTRLCDLVLNGPPADVGEVDTTYRTGMHVQSFQKELSWIIRVLRGAGQHPVMQMPRRRAAVGAMVDLLKPHYRFDILSLSDPMPGIRMLRNFAALATKPLRSRFRRSAAQPKSGT